MGRPHQNRLADDGQSSDDFGWMKVPCCIGLLHPLRRISAISGGTVGLGNLALHVLSRQTEFIRRIRNQADIQPHEGHRHTI